MRFRFCKHTPGSNLQVHVRFLLWLALSSTLLAGCGLGSPNSSANPTSATPTSSPSTGATPTPTSAARLSPAWQAVLAQIGPNGDISLNTAEQAYMLAFGPLPGLQSPPTPTGLLPSASLAVSMILQHYANLTTAQQQAVLSRLDFSAPPSANAHIASPPATLTTSERASAHHAPRVLGTLSQPLLVPPVPTDVPGTTGYRAMVNSFIPKYNAYLGYAYSLPVTLAFDTNTPYEAYADGIDANNSYVGAPVYCRISINPEVNGFTSDRQAFIIAHELFHCYQFAIQNHASVTYHSPKWLTEGSATWAGAVVSGATDTIPELQGYWAAWLELDYPDYPLLKRTYSAVGFYALLNQAGINPWSVLPSMLQSQLKGKVPDNDAAYKAATAKAPQAVLNQWASSYERDPSLGAAWDLTGPAIIPKNSYGQIADQQETVNNGDFVNVATEAYTAADYALTVNADVLRINLTGTSRMIDSAKVERVADASGNYCLKQGGCTCPSGSTYHGPALQQLTGQITLALSGGPSGTAGFVSGMSLQEFCSKTKPLSAPTISTEFCQSILSVPAANAIMQPAIPAKTIVATPPSSLPGCGWLYQTNPPDSIVEIFFETWNGPIPIPQQGIDAAVAKLEQSTGASGVTVDVATSVSGVGDQAYFLAASVPATKVNPAYRIEAFYTLYGHVLFLSANLYYRGSDADTTQESKLKQVAQLVVKRLDP